MNSSEVPDENEYTVVGCSNCENLKIIQGCPEKTKCGRCGKSMKFKELKKFYMTKERELAIRARALKLAERNEDAETYKQLLEEGKLDKAEAGVISDEKFLSEQGINIDSNESEKSNLKEVILSQIKSGNDKDEIISELVEEYSEQEVRDMIKKLKRNGEIAETSSGLRRV